MGKKLQNIYELLNSNSENYSEEEINEMIMLLVEEDRILLRERYGEDLHNPVASENFDKTKSRKFYTYLVPKMKQILLENRIKSLENKVSKDNELELRSKLLDLINNKSDNNKICETLNIDRQQLYRLLLDLKNNGIAFANYYYYSDASIRYKLVHTISELKRVCSIGQDISIITDSKENNIKLLVMTDPHFGNELERIDLVNRAYNYCIKNGINIILCCGDFIDGSYSSGKQKITNIYEQAMYFLKNYPCDKNIITMGVGGDHDLSALTYGSLNLIELCNNYRHDIIIGGYNNSGINIKNDQILLYHHIANGKIRLTNDCLILKGGTHNYSTQMINDALNVRVPSISNIMQPMPSVLELNLDFKKGYINTAVLKQIYFGEQDVVLNESEYDLLSNRAVDYVAIRNVEPYKEYIPSEKQVEKKLEQSLSAVEKFNKRYGL